MNVNDIDEAAEKFKNIFVEVLDKHAPLKVIQVRKNYVPYLSEETKILMKERDTLKIDATKYNDEVLFKEYKKKRKEVKEKLKKDKEEYSNRILDKKGVSSKEMWKSVKDVLKLNKNLAPTKLKIDGEIVSSPETLANAFNDIFIKKSEGF